MKTKTLFMAYMNAERAKWYAEHLRRYPLGIAVENDTYAREWQRHERLSKKLVRKILDRLEAQP